MRAPDLAQFFESEELILQGDGTLEKQFRVVGTNKVGMLAWHVMMRTPEYPEGREIVVIANDVTFQSGSFGVAEVSQSLFCSSAARLVLTFCCAPPRISGLILCSLLSKEP